MARGLLAEGSIPMATYAIHADKFFLPGGPAQGGFLTVNDDKFGIWSAEAPEGLEVRDYTGSWIAPGYVDTHIHGFGGHATSDADAAGIIASSEALAKRGTTSWLPTTFTESAEHIGDCCEAIADAADKAEGLGLEYRGAHIQGIYLEGPFFTMEHVGAQDPAYLCDPSYELFCEWQRRARGRIVKSAFAPERDGSVEYAGKLDAAGIIACIGHSGAVYEQAIAAVNAGASVFVHTYNGMRGLHHRQPGVLGCALSAPSTYAEVICDGRHVVPASIKVLLEAKGWHHSVIVSDCLGCGGMPEGHYVSGGLPVVMKEGLCYLENEDGSLGNIAGSTTTLAEEVRNLVDWGLASAEDAIRMATEIPAQSARMGNRCGSIRPHRDADFVVLDHTLKLKETYLAGESLGEL